VSKRVHVPGTGFLVSLCALAMVLAFSVVTVAWTDRGNAESAGRGSDLGGSPPAASRAEPHAEAEADAEADGSAESSAERRSLSLADPAPGTGLAQAAIDAAEQAAAASTELAVAVLDRVTGEIAVGDNGREPYYTASLSKLVVIVDILDRRRLDGLVVTDADLALIRQALGPSDDSAMNALWTRFDGPGAADRLSERLGLVGTTGPRDPTQWGEMSVPAVDMVRIWQHILEEMPAADRDLVISAMQAAPATADSGFDQTFGLLAPDVDGPGGPGAVAKQGWMCCFSGEYYLHSVGAVGSDQRYLVALLTRVPRGPGWESARHELTDIATATVHTLT
jgi:hypothetical protein